MNAIKKLPWYVLVALLASGLTVGACSSDEKEAAAPSVPSSRSPSPGPAVSVSADGSSYLFERPDAASALPDDLVEISGLAPLDDGRLVAVQDEEGILYFLDPAKGAITERIAFGDGADYEGIESVDDRLFVLRSNGNLLEVSGWGTGAPSVRTHETDLRARHDTEGLAYDATRDRLLIVTKEDPGEDLDEDRYKAVYEFDPATGELTAEPVLVIDLEDVESAIPGVETFKPSALAVHPASGDLYVLSSTEQALVVFGPGGDLRHAWRLSQAQFEQPEGLAFFPNGDVFISSEGVDGPPMLFRFAETR